MKKLILAAFVLLAAVSCTKDSSNEVSNPQAEQGILVPVKVHVGGFSVTQEDFPATRAAQDVADYSGVKAVTLAFYSGSTEVLKTTQLRGDASTYDTFGEFECSLPMGNYTMVVLAHGKDVDDELVLTSPTQAEYIGGHTRETFAATQTVNITNAEGVDISATLDRIVAKLQVVSSDGRTANATNIRMSFTAGGKSFNPTTGLATSDTGFANTVGISKAVGETTASVTYLFLTSDEQEIDLTIETLDANGDVLFSKTINKVPFKRNRLTKLTGAMYSNDAMSGTFLLNTSWLPEYSDEF